MVWCVPSNTHIHSLSRLLPPPILYRVLYKRPYPILLLPVCLQALCLSLQYLYVYSVSSRRFPSITLLCHCSFPHYTDPYRHFSHNLFPYTTTSITTEVHSLSAASLSVTHPAPPSYTPPPTLTSTLRHGAKFPRAHVHPCTHHHHHCNCTITH